MRAFEVGDRVAVYGGVEINVPNMRLSQKKATVISERSGESENIEVRFDDNIRPLFVHPKQCRRPKKVRPREWWINFYDEESGDVAHRTPELANKHYVNGRKELVYVREVKVKK